MNKLRLINFLKQYFTIEGTPVMQARGDADLVIGATTLEEAGKLEYPVVTVGNDTDLQVALTILADPSYDLHVVREVEPAEIWKISGMQDNCKDEARELIIVVYCFTGCNSTSTPFKKGKAKAVDDLNKLTGKEIMQLKAFAEPNSTAEQLVEALKQHIFCVYHAVQGMDKEKWNTLS